MIHDLDLIRHGLAFSFAWYNWITNVTASLVIFIAISMFWPRARAAYKRFFTGHMADLHEKLDSHHAEHLSLIESNHKKQMDQIAKNHKEVLSHVARPIVRPAPKTPPTKGTTNVRPVK